MQEEPLETAERKWFLVLLLDIGYRADLLLRTVPRYHGLESGRAKAVEAVLPQAGRGTGSLGSPPEYRPFITL